MRRMTCIIICSLVFNLTINCLCSAAPPVPEGRRLRDIVAENFPDGHVFIGAATGWDMRPGGSGVTIDREFSYVTPENDFKQNIIHPSPGIWNWDDADQWIPHSATQHQVIRMHSPIGPQCSLWAKEDNRTPAELKNNLTEFMTALCARYSKYRHVLWMDVVNETILDDGNWNGPKPGTEVPENPWLKIGVDEHHPLKPPLYIKLAFEIATKSAPNLQLIINQHGGMQDPMWKKVKDLVHYLRDQGLRVDGIGWQAHVDAGWEKNPKNIEKLHQLIRWAHLNNLSFHVTENTVWLKQQKDYQVQADTYSAVLHVLLEHRRTGVVTWNTWNLSDKEAWKRTRSYDGSIFDDRYQPKPAYYALQRLLEHPPAAQ